MRVLALCAGIGGLELGIQLANPAAYAVCYVENGAYPAACLASRMGDRRIRPAPIWNDVATFNARAWRGAVDCVSAGYPCQPFSVAGSQQGEADRRNVWPHISRILDDAEPAIAFLENVRGHVRRGLRDVWGDLRGKGFAVRFGLFSASEIGAPHIRARLFILAAHADRGAIRFKPERDQRNRRRVRATECGDAFATSASTPRTTADADNAGCGKQWGPRATAAANASVECSRRDWRSEHFPEPGIRRVAVGAPYRLERLRALGNSVVPQTAALAWRSLWDQM